MKKEELQNWIKSAKYIDTPEDTYDDNTNRYTTNIYEKDGKLYKIEYCNGHFYEKWGKTGFIRGEYGEPIEVKKVKRMVEVISYE